MELLITKDYIEDMRSLAEKIKESRHTAYFQVNEETSPKHYWWYFVRLKKNEIREIKLNKANRSGSIGT